MFLKRAAALLTASTLATVGITAMASPAAAAAADICNKQATHAAFMPTYGTGSGSTGGTINCYMGPSYGAVISVKAFQVSYNQCYAKPLGFEQLREDGDYGPKTTTAVANVQRYHGLSEDGLYGPATAGKMIFFVGVCL